MLAAGDDRQHGGNDGYDDEPERVYRWDNTVPNHAGPSSGHAIILWDKKVLLGASVIERIEEGTTTKPLYRCSACGAAHIKRRRTLDPPWRCFSCSTNFREPRVQSREVHTYVSLHEEGWIDLHGALTGAQLRSLCESPKSQLSLRPLRWPDFRSALRAASLEIPLTVLDTRADRLRGGYTRRTVRVRLGQASFRGTMLAEHGPVCAITGPAPAATLEAGHLYSYAEVGEHHRHGGLLLRRDVHRLFDLGQIAVDPKSLMVDVAPSLRGYVGYASLHGAEIAVRVTDSHRRWLADHWAEHRLAQAF